MPASNTLRPSDSKRIRRRLLLHGAAPFSAPARAPDGSATAPLTGRPRTVFSSPTPHERLAPAAARDPLSACPSVSTGGRTMHCRPGPAAPFDQPTADARPTAAGHPRRGSTTPAEVPRAAGLGGPLLAWTGDGALSALPDVVTASVSTSGLVHRRRRTSSLGRVVGAGFGRRARSDPPPRIRARRMRERPHRHHRRRPASTRGWPSGSALRLEPVRQTGPVRRSV